MTKEEILEPCIQTHREVQIVELGDAINCMDEYAKQQAIAFLAWHSNKLMQFEMTMATPQSNGIELWKEMRRFEEATIENRYDLFIEQQNKDNDKMGV